MTKSRRNVDKRTTSDYAALPDAYPDHKIDSSGPTSPEGAVTKRDGRRRADCAYLLRDIVLRVYERHLVLSAGRRDAPPPSGSASCVADPGRLCRAKAVIRNE